MVQKWYWILEFADLEEKFHEVFEKFEKIEKDDESCVGTTETSVDDANVDVENPAVPEHKDFYNKIESVEYLVI